MPVREGHTARQRREQRRERLRIGGRLEIRALPVTLEHDVAMTADDQCERLMLAGIVRCRRQCLRIELLALRRDVWRLRLVAAGYELRGS